jgi:hypothetical protein
VTWCAGSRAHQIVPFKARRKATGNFAVFRHALTGELLVLREHPPSEPRDCRREQNHDSGKDGATNGAAPQAPGHHGGG